MSLAKASKWFFEEEVGWKALKARPFEFALIAALIAVSLALGFAQLNQTPPTP